MFYIRVFITFEKKNYLSTQKKLLYKEKFSVISLTCNPARPKAINLLLLLSSAS